MSDQVRGELKRIVEQAVRPVRASDARKMQMREEMLEHLSAIHAEELDRLGSQEATLLRTRERFGDPLELANELQQSLPKYESFLYCCDFWRYRPGDSLMGYAVRHLVLALTCMGVMVLLTLPAIWMWGRGSEIGAFLHMALVTAMFSALFSASFVLVGERMGQILYGQGAPHPMRALTGWSLVSLLVFPAATALVYGGLMLSLDKTLEGLLVGCMAAPAAPIFFFAMAHSMKEHIIRESQWRAIELDG